ncbi:MAG TPA: lysophospholipid acyltransferase family protein [Chthoniobacterales bacterium]|jgi:hypothetical protein
MSLRYRVVRKIGYFLRLRLETEPGWLWRAAMAILAWLMRMHGSTLRFVVEDKPGYFAKRFDGPVILLLWHNRIASMPAFFERRHNLRAFVLTSASPEGSLLAEFLGHFGLGAVRGSTSRRGSIAIREIARRIAEGKDIIITPDGPRGPRYRLQPGALYLAQRTGRPIVPVHVESSRYVRFKSWDGFALPLPFATVTVTYGEPCWINASSTDDELETERRRLEVRMTESMSMDRPQALDAAPTSLSPAGRNKSS